MHLNGAAAVLALVLLDHFATHDCISHQLHVVVRELPDFGVVHAEDLCFFGSAETEARDEVHDEEDKARAAEAVGEAGEGVGQLVGELHPVSVEPAAGDFGEAIKVSNVLAGGNVSRDISGLRYMRDGAYAAKIPVRRLPTKPPMACTAKISRASSMPRTNLSFVA